MSAPYFLSFACRGGSLPFGGGFVSSKPFSASSGDSGWRDIRLSALLLWSFAILLAIRSRYELARPEAILLT